MPEITFKFNPACNTHGVKEGTFGLHIEGINNEKAIQEITRAECARKVRELILILIKCITFSAFIVS